MQKESTKVEKSTSVGNDAKLPVVRSFYRYRIDFRVRAKHQKEYNSGSISLKTLEDVGSFVLRMKAKYEYCEFEKYDSGYLVSSFS